nr:ThiF family adenylyltransferase [Thermobacillus composti]
MRMSPSSERYARQVRFSPFGMEGQKRLAQGFAVVVGMGALGCVIANHLVRAGIGRIRLIDRDIVSWSNLHRQLLYTEADAESGVPKAEAAAAQLRTFNRQVAIEAAAVDLNSGNAESLLADADLIVDGTDHFGVRYLINDVAVKFGIPWIYGGAVGASGMTMTIVPGETPCYRCLFPSPPPPGSTDTCETAGVLPPIVDLIGSLQAMEAIKLLGGYKEQLHGALLHADLWKTDFSKMKTAGARRADCPCCGIRRFDYLEAVVRGKSEAVLCGRETVQIAPAEPLQLHLDEMAERLKSAGRVERNPWLLRLTLEDGITLVLFPDGRVLVQGTGDPDLARRIYDRILAP